MNKPKLIVITPVRNEAWVLEAFLTHCSSWADHIIIADQHSTDGSREIAARFPKVILIDNPDEEMHQANVRLLLFKEVDKIKGKKIVWAMDADEFLSEGFLHTKGWETILNSQPDSIFCFRWQNLIHDFCHEDSTPLKPAEWACYFNPETCISELYAQAEKKAIHEARVPCTKNAHYITIDDIQFVHLARINITRTRNKNDFYQVSTLNKLSQNISAVSLFRTYHYIPAIHTLKQDVVLTTADGTSRLNHLVHTSDHGQYYIDEIVSILKREGLNKFQKLSIWDNPDICAAGIQYQTPLCIRLLHGYLRNSQRYSETLVVRIIDKLLKIIVK